MPAAGRHWLCGRRRGCSQHVVVYQRACNAFSTTPAELPTSPRPYAVTAIAAARTQHKRLWLAANLSAAKQDPVGWLRLPTFHFQGPARRSFPKQISQFVASAVRAAIAVDLLRSSTANQPGDFADMPRELRQPSTWPYAAHTHSLISRSTSSTRALPKCPLPTLIAGAARTLAADRAR
jgi:hypothetical protein